MTDAADQPDLVHLIYSSAASVRPVPSDLVHTILEQSRRNNTQADITGVLLYHEGSFFQVLEGPVEAVERVYRRICDDARHRNVQKLIQEPIEQRAFGDWTMGYPKASQRDLEEIEGLNDFFLGGSTFTDLDQGRAKMLITGFKKGRWRQD